MNTGVRHQNQADYLYPEEDQDYDENEQYDEQYMDEGQQYDQYEDHRYHQQNPSSHHRDQYEDYSRSKSPNVGRGMRQDDDDGYRGTQRSTAKESMNQQSRYTAQSRGGYNDNAHHGHDQGYDENYEEPQSITEVIDANRVKTSKLFQKFLQKENKVNPNKPAPAKNVKAGSTSPINRKSAKETVKPKNSTSKSPQYQDHVRDQGRGQYSPNNQGFTHEAQQFKDRAIPNYHEQEEGYGQPHRESPHQGDFQQQGGFNSNFHRAQSNEYDYPQDPRSNPDLDLNQQSSSKLVSLQNAEGYPPQQNFPGFQQGSPPNGQFMMPPGGFPYGYGMNPEMMKAQQQQYQNQNSPMGNPGEVFMLRAQLAEMSQAMQREIEANKTLDMKCTEYLGQLEKSAQNFEEFKQKLFDQGSGHQEETRRLEDKIRHLNDALNEKDRQEEQQTAEINRLKKKLDAELESRGRLLEEHDDLERRKFEELDSLKREVEQKDEELSRLRREHDSSRHDKDSFKSSEERFLREIRGLKADNTELNRINEDLRKAVDDKTQQLNLANMEINSVRNQLDTMDGQYRDLLSENDRTKRDTFGLKERLLAAESEIKTLQMTLEKTQINIDQAAEALSRTEGALERERRVNADLRAQIAAETRNNNQWDTPQSQNRGGGSRTFDEPSQTQQPYSRQERQEPVTQSRPQTNQFQPTKYEMKRDNASRPYTAEEPQQQRGQRYQEPIQNEQPNRRQQQQQQEPYYQENNNNRFGGRDNNTPNQNSRNQRGGWGNNEPIQEPYQQQQQQPRYDDRPIKGQQRNQPQNEDPYNSRNAQNRREEPVVNPGMKRSVHEQYGNGPNQAKLSSLNQVYKPTGNLLAWDEPPVDNKPVNRQRKEERPPVEENVPMNMGGRRQQQQQNNYQPPVEENAPMNFGGRRQQQQQQNYQPPEERTTPVNNQKQNQAPVNTGVVFGKEDHKPPQDLTQVKGFETELMNLQMQKDNINNELQRLDKVKIKSGANIKRKQELESELSFVQSSISNVKTKLRELNVLLPF